MKVSEIPSQLAATLKGLVKIGLQSRPGRLDKMHRDHPLIIMANGPSLNQTIAENADVLRDNDTMSVNFAPLSPVFFDLRPKFHVLADPLFFANEPPFNVVEMYKALQRVDWPLTLVVPVKYRKKLTRLLADNPHLEVATFNPVGVEGFGWFRRLSYRSRLAMPRPRNVLIPALMCGIWMGYRRIYVVGADHSWMQTISVDDDNNVISVQPHFYKDDKREQQRVDTTYRNYRLHDIVHSFYVAFRSYHILSDFARNQGVEIINSTPGSFIDAFKRDSLPARSDKSN